MMLGIMIAVFVLGYVCIAMEHKLQINKAAPALLTAGVLWSIYIIAEPLCVQHFHGKALQEFLLNNPTIAAMPLLDQCIQFIVRLQIVESLGDISETLFFLIGAMTIVELIDVHGGFSIITNRITTRKKIKLLWLITLLSFFMSAVLDNMTTSIVMVMLIRRIIPEKQERWLFACAIILAANSGGAWSPIGDVTTIMLWVKGNVTSLPLIDSLLIPSIVSTVIPVLFIGRQLGKGEIAADGTEDPISTNVETILTPRERTTMLSLGIGCLLFVPVFKSITHLPPFMGIMVGLGIMWVYTELLYRKKLNIAEQDKHRVTRVIRHIDIPTILFFLGILMAVSALQATGILNSLSEVLEAKLHNIYLINIIIGLLSSVVDNVPLVAGAMGMYPIVDPAAVGQLADPAFMQHFVQDGPFWLFLAYCAGVGGSLLIIGSAAGVVVMGLEKIDFVWYFKHITFVALLGYLAGAAAFILIEWIKLGAAL